MLRIAFFGDMAVPSCPRINDLEAFTSHYDIAVANLEASLECSAKPIKKLHNLSCKGKELEIMMRLFNIGYVNLANNHVMDFGQEGLEQLLNVLDEYGVRYFGAGAKRNLAETPAFLTYGDLEIAFLGFSWGPIETVSAKCEDSGAATIPSIKRLEKLIRDTRKICTHLVLIFHWGYEFESYPLPLHRKVAHAAIDNGASLVLGHHPHIFQGKEIYKETLIYYSLGDFFLPVYGRKGKSIGIAPIIEFREDSLREQDLLFVSYDHSDNELCAYQNLENRAEFELLSEPMRLGNRDYCSFFRRNRRRKRGLPVFDGSILDKFRYPWMDLRSATIRFAVRNSIYKREENMFK